MTIKNLKNVLICTLLLTGTCLGQSDQSKMANTKLSVGNAFKAIHTRDQVVEYFGQPLYTRHTSDYDVLIYDLLGSSPRTEGKHIFSGFQVYVQGQKIIKWTPVYSDIYIQR